MSRPIHPRVYKTEAVVLKRVDLGEADRIVTFYTPQLGKLRAVAKGVRKTTSRMAGHLELLSRSSLMLAVGSNLDVVTQAQVVDAYPRLRESLELISCGLYLAELVDQVTPDRLESSPIFELLTWALPALVEERVTDLVLRFAELRLLTVIGYRPQLHECVRCHEPLTPATHGFSPSLGGVVCRSCAGGDDRFRALSLNALKTLRFVQSSPWSDVRRLHLPAPLAAEVASTLREYLRFVVERDLKSAQLLDTVRQKGPAH